MSTVRLRRLQADYEKLRAFLAQQPRIRLIQAQGTPPERYQLEFQIKGLREIDQQLQTVANHMVEIALPLSYPRLPPQCRMLTPVFHPNIAPHAICIGDHWAAGEPLWSMVARIGEMIAYQSYNTKSPLNGEAARWVEANQDRLPLDKTNFVMDDSLPKQEEASDPSVIPFAADRATPQPIPAVQPAVPSPAIASVRGPAGASPGPGAIPVARPVPAGPRAMPSPPVAATGSSAPSPSSAANIIIQCEQCGSRYSVPPTAAGRKVRCKKCQAILVIPAKQSPQ
jgi:ubiquitin-protein ligase